MDENDEDCLYSDLPTFKYNESLDKLQSSNKVLQERVAELEKQVDILTKENKEYETNNSILKENISSFIKTARIEVRRKDNRITELNKEITTLKTQIFRLTKRIRNEPLKKRTGTDLNESSPKRLKRTRESSILKDSNISTTEKKADEPTVIKTNEPSVIQTDEPTIIKNVETTISESDEPSKVRKLVVPNVPLPTLYSQRMFRKIYNVDPVSNTPKEISDPGINNDCEKVENNTGPVGFSLNKIDKSSPTINEDLRNRKSGHIEPETIKSKDISSKHTDIGEDNTKLLEMGINRAPTTEYINKSKSIVKHHVSSILHSSSVISITKNNDTEGFIKDNQRKEIKSTIVSVQSSELKEKDTLQKVTFEMSKKSFETNNQIEDNANKNSACKLKSDVPPNNQPCSMLGMNRNLLNRQSKTTVHPISQQWNEFHKKKIEVEEKDDLACHNNSPSYSDNKNCNDKIELMEKLFGSPLKWTDNSSDTIKEQVPQINPSYEDSCSAQIENAKFKKIGNTDDVSFIKTIKEIQVSKNESLIEEQQNSPVNKIGSSLNTSGNNKIEGGLKRPFEQVKIDKSETSNFSCININKNSKTCTYTSLSLDIDQNSSEFPKSVKSPKVKCPKYNDSLLGQFDDTTQLISALAKDHSKISPIHTPIKESKKDEVESLPNEKILSIGKVNFTSPTRLSATKKPEKKAIFLEQPINVLCPRKTPRNVSSSKSVPLKKNAENLSDSSSKVDQSLSTLLNQAKDTQVVTATGKYTKSVSTSHIKVSAISKGVLEKVKDVVARERADMKRRLKHDENKTSCDENNREPVKLSEGVNTFGHKSKASDSPKILEYPSSKKSYNITNKSPSSKSKKETPLIIEARDRRDYSKTTFKRPLSSSAYRRQNCNFRQSSVERKLQKDRRHTTRSRITPVRVIKKGGIDSDLSQENKSSKSHIQSRNISDHSPAKTHHIIRSTNKIDWTPTTTSIILAKPTEKNTESRMKWLLRPIDFNTTQSSTSVKNSETKINSNIQPQITPNSSINESTIKDNVPTKSSNIIIVPRRRPAKFGVSETCDLGYFSVKKTSS